MKHLALLVISLSTPGLLSAMHRSPIIVTDYQPTAAVLGDSLQTWCNKEKNASHAPQAPKKIEAPEMNDQPEAPVFDPYVDRWVKSMCVTLVQSGAYQKDPEFVTKLLLRKAIGLQGLVDWSLQKSEENKRD
jgi:hypothetical protein